MGADGAVNEGEEKGVKEGWVIYIWDVETH